MGEGPMGASGGQSPAPDGQRPASGDGRVPSGGQQPDPAGEHHADLVGGQPTAASGGQRGSPVRVRRGGPDEPERWDTFEVPYSEGMSVLDGLIWVREHVDPTLAIRYSCTNANACKECVARIDGKNGYLCTARLAADGTTVEPLGTRGLIRDNVVDLK